MRLSHALALSFVVCCISIGSVARGSIAARVQAVTAARAQAASSAATPLKQEEALLLDALTFPGELEAADRELPVISAPKLEEPARQAASPGLEPSSHPSPSATRVPPTPGHSTRLNVADWFNQSVRVGSSVSEPAATSPSIRAAERPESDHSALAAGQSSRRRTAHRDSSAESAPENYSLPALSDAVATKPSIGPTLSDVPSVKESPREPAMWSAGEGAPIESHGAAADQNVSDSTSSANATRTNDSPADDSVEASPTSPESAQNLADSSSSNELADRSGEDAGQLETPVDPPAPPKQFSPKMLRVRDRIRACLTYYYQRPENVSERSPWGVMHSLIAFGVDTEIQVGKDRVNAIGWLCYNRPCRGMQLLELKDGYVTPRNGPGYQGHEGQLASMLALSRVKPTYPIRVDGQEFTVMDLIEYEKWSCRPRSELTFKLIALAHYLPSDATWTSKGGQEWDIPRLMREELAQPINGACCGGTHRLIGYSMAVQTRAKRGEPLDGQWLRAAKYVDNYHKYVIKLQNGDGSFSTSWLKARDDSGEIDRRIQTTGHILEWLVFSLPVEELTDPRIVAAVNYLNNALMSDRTRDWEIGPRGHALRALALYNERVFGDTPGQRRAVLARRPSK